MKDDYLSAEDPLLDPSDAPPRPHPRCIPPPPPPALNTTLLRPPAPDWVAEDEGAVAGELPMVAATFMMAERVFTH